MIKQYAASQPFSLTPTRRSAAVQARKSAVLLQLLHSAEAVAAVQAFTTSVLAVH
jgi:hypothetical protein